MNDKNYFLEKNKVISAMLYIMKYQENNLIFTNFKNCLKIIVSVSTLNTFKGKTVLLYTVDLNIFN